MVLPIEFIFYVRFCLVSYNASRAVQNYFVSWLPHTPFLRLAFSRNRDMDQWEEMTRSVSFHVILLGLLYYSSLRFGDIVGFVAFILYTTGI